MTNEELADEMIARLNALLESGPGAREAVSAIFQTRLAVPRALLNHPTILVRDHASLHEPGPGGASVSPMGILNGAIGNVGGDGPRKDWGLVSAVTDGMSETIQRFVRTRETP